MTDIVPTLINGRWELNLPDHRAARPQWLVENGGWETERLSAMYDRIKPGTVVFDCGAEEGDFPALFTTWGARVVLFEPNPYVWPNIRFIWDANNLPAPHGFFTGFACNQTNLRPSDMEPIFAEPDRDGWPACTYGPVIGDHGFRNVSERFHDTPQIRIDDYCATSGIYPELLTLDVEGAELEVLKGAEQTLRDVRPIVFVSIHPTFIPAMYGYEAQAVHDFMDSVGYLGEHLATDHEEHWVFTAR
jgi:FkbM family methyltransferase